MKITVVIEGKKYKLSFWEWIAYKNQRQLNRIEEKLDKVLIVPEYKEGKQNDERQSTTKSIWPLEPYRRKCGRLRDSL